MTNQHKIQPPFHFILFSNPPKKKEQKLKGKVKMKNEKR